MADEKKYTAQEAALAVLQKTSEILKESSLMKAEKGVHMPANTNQRATAGKSKVGMDVRQGVGSAAGNKAAHASKLNELKDMPKPNLPKSEGADENEIGTKFQKNEAPPGEIKPKEHVEGEPMKPGARVDTQVAPQANPKEKMEGNNPPSGAVPGNGVMKLAFFLGHRHNKKKSQKTMV